MVKPSHDFNIYEQPLFNISSTKRNAHKNMGGWVCGQNIEHVPPSTINNEDQPCADPTLVLLHPLLQEFAKIQQKK